MRTEPSRAGFPFALLAAVALAVAALLPAAPALAQNGDDLWGDGSQDAAQAPEDEEVPFARRLIDLGFDEMALEQLQRTRQREFLPAEVRLEATRRLAGCHEVVARRKTSQGDLIGRRDHLTAAVAEYERYLKEAADLAGPRQVADGHYAAAGVATTLAGDSYGAMEAAAEAEDRADYKQGAVEWFESADEHFQTAAKWYVPERQRAAGKPSVEEKLYYQDVSRQAGLILLDRARMLHDFAQVYDRELAEEQATSDGLLDTAIGLLRDDIVKNYSLYDIRYIAERYIGMCYRLKQEYKQAIEHLTTALSVRATPENQWMIRRSRYNLARAYNDWGKHDEAMVQVDALLSSLYDVIEVRGDPALRDIYLAARIEKARALMLRARYLAGKVKEYRQQEKNVLARGAAEQSASDSAFAVDILEEAAADTKSKWRWNAKTLVLEARRAYEELQGKKYEPKPTIQNLSTQALELMKEGKFFEAITAFRQAVQLDPRGLHRKDLLPECWYQMGLCYYRLSADERTGGNNHYYYECATIFEHVARTYPDSPFGAPAAYVAQQFHGAIFDLTRRQLRNEEAVVKQSDLIYDGTRYAESMRLFAESFPDDPRSEGMVFQGAEIARTIGEFERAAELYSRVREGQDGFNQALHNAGYCLYLQALKLYEEHPDDPPVQKLGELVEGAAAHYREHLQYFNDRRGVVGRERLEGVVNPAAVRTRLDYGKLLVHDVWAVASDKAEGARQALELMQGFEDTHFADGLNPELRREALPQAFLVNVQAYEKLDRLPEAEEFVRRIVDQFGQKSELSSRAAALLGYAYMRKRRELEEAEAPEAQVSLASSKAGEYLGLALNYDPEQTLEVYVFVAGDLLETGEDEQAVKLLGEQEGGLKRFPIEDPAHPTDLQLRALDVLIRAYRHLAEDSSATYWTQVERYAAMLHGALPDNLDYMIELASAQEKVGKFDEARRLWARAKKAAGEAIRVYQRRAEDATALQGSAETPAARAEARATLERVTRNLARTREDEFNATWHIAYNYAKQGNGERGSRIVLFELLSDKSWLRDRTERIARIKELFAGELKDYRGKLAEITMDHLRSDPNLLRNQQTREGVLSLAELFPEQKGEIERMIQEGAVELRTGD